VKLFDIKTNFDEIPEMLNELNMEFVQVSRDFLHVAKTISKVIISEVFLPLDQKIIKPATLGGVIGGEKYIVQAVLFKFAVQRAEHSVTTQIASKVAGHELKSLSHLWECKISDLCLPLQCLIDYLGFRMVAMLLLPLDGSKTLKGINVRYMGIVYKHCTTIEARTILLKKWPQELSSKPSEKKIREKMSELKFPLENPYVEIVVA